MSRFKFRLQKVLDHRELIQEKAKTEYMEALKKVQDKEAQIEQMFEDILSARRDFHSNSSPITHVQLNEFAEGQEIKIGREKLELRTLRVDLEDKHEKYIQAFQDLKVLESLKEKKRVEHKSEQLKKEQDEADDMTSMRFKRR